MSYTLSRLIRNQHIEDGQLLLHSELGVAYFRGVRMVESFAGLLSQAAPRPMLLLEFADKQKKYVDVKDVEKLHLLSIDSSSVGVLQVDSLAAPRKEWLAFQKASASALSEAVSIPRPEDKPKRRALTEQVRHEVWRRDQGQCAKCGSRERLEYDHIVPVVKGGSNTARNIELLCEQCNRRKGCSI